MLVVDTNFLSTQFALIKLIKSATIFRNSIEIKSSAEWELFWNWFKSGDKSDINCFQYPGISFSYIWPVQTKNLNFKDDKYLKDPDDDFRFR